MATVLRKMQASDLQTVLAWRNSDGVRQNMYTYHTISEEEHLAWWASQKENQATRLLICEIDEDPVGVVTFTKYTGPGGRATWAFYSGEMSRRGIGRAMEVAALHFAFEELGVRRLECEVLSFNRAVVDFHLKHGFTLEGISRQAYFRDGEYHDIYQLSMLAEEWFKRVKPHLESPSGASLVGYAIDFPVAVSAELVDAYSQVTGDNNPIHLDATEAKRLGFPDRIAHGMLIGGFISKCFAKDFPGPGTIYVSQSLNFQSPIFVGSNAVVRLKVTSHIARRITVATTILVDEIICVSGEAVLILPAAFNAKPPVKVEAGP